MNFNFFSPRSQLSLHTIFPSRKISSNWVETTEFSIILSGIFVNCHNTQNQYKRNDYPIPTSRKHHCSDVE